MPIPITFRLRVLTSLMIIGIIAMNTQLVLSARPKAPAAPPRPPPAPKGPPGPIRQGFSDMFDFIKYCALYMHVTWPRFLKPNEKCCTSAKKVNISYFCKVFFIPNTERVFSPRKVAHVAKYCNNPLPIRSRCGCKSPFLYSSFFKD